MTEPAETTALTTSDDRGLRLAGPRLPYHPALEERYGIDRGTWKVLCEAFYPLAEGPESIIMAVSYCKARNLDIMKKPVHIVPVYDKKRGRMVDTVWPAISETRITAMRTQHYAGKDETVFGPEITATLGGTEVTYPEWASVTVYRFVQGVRCAFTGERVRWLEYYAKAKRDSQAPNEMWRVKAYSQLSKCAEASALRCAFPEEDSGPTAEEMEGQSVESTQAPESITGSGVMGRLQGADTATGMDRGHVERETAALPAPDGDSPVERVKAKRAARKAAAERPAEPVEDEERPTETAGAQPAEHEPDSPASAEPAAEGSQDQKDSGQPVTDGPTTAGAQDAINEAASAEVENIEGAPEDVITEGYPSENEVYMLNGDEWAFDEKRGEDRRDTYKNREPFSDAGRDKGYLIYEDHAPEDQQVEAEAEDLPPALATLIEATETVDSWDGVKEALKAFQADPLWKTLGEDQQNHIRASTWETLVERAGNPREGDLPAIDWLPDHHRDLSAFRLWVEVQTDPGEIKAALALLQADEAVQTKAAALKSVSDATEARLLALQA